MQPTQPTPAPSPISVNVNLPPRLQVPGAFEFVWQEKIELGNGSNLSAGRVLELPVNRNLPYRSVYTYLFATGAAEMLLQMGATLALNKTPVGKLPISAALFNTAAGVSVFNSSVPTFAVAPGIPVSNAVQFVLAQSFPTERVSVSLNPFSFCADCDSINVAIEKSVSAVSYRCILACLSTRHPTYE